MDVSGGTPSTRAFVPAIAGLAFVEEIDRICGEKTEEFCRREGDSEERARSLITHGEMHALLEPLQSCLARIERTLKEFACTSPPSQDVFGDGHPASPIQGRMPVVPETQFTSNPESQDEPCFDKDGLNSGNEDFTRMVSNSGTTFQDEDGMVSNSGTTAVDEGAPKSSPKSPKPRLQQGASEINKVLNRTKDDEEENQEVAERLEVDKVLQLEGLGDEINLADRMALRMERSAKWWAGLTEPKRNSCVYRTAESQSFENLCIVIILFNSALVAVRADWQVQNIGRSEPAVLDVFENVCFVWFLLELIIRMAAHRHHFFFNADMVWNLFDLTLVTISMVDFVFSVIVRIQGGNNVAFMRVLRLLKMARIFRSLRSFRFFKSLELLLAAIEYLTSGDEDPVIADNAKYYFGSFGATFLSLYMGVTGGDDWINLYTITAAAGWAYGVVLALFTFFFLFAIFNILTGTLVEKAMTTSKPDRTDMILRTRKKNADEKKQFLKLCTALDHDNDGKVSLDEFRTWMDNEVMLCYMQSIGIEIHDVELFFGTVACREGRSGSILSAGEVTIEHFVEGCMNMRGTATALDMQRQLFEMHVLHHDLQHLKNSFNHRLQNLEQLLCQSSVGTLPTRSDGWSSKHGQPSSKAVPPVSNSISRTK